MKTNFNGYTPKEFNSIVDETSYVDKAFNVVTVASCMILSQHSDKLEEQTILRRMYKRNVVEALDVTTKLASRLSGSNETLARNIESHCMNFDKNAQHVSDVWGRSKDRLINTVYSNTSVEDLWCDWRSLKLEDDDLPGDLIEITNSAIVYLHSESVYQKCHSIVNNQLRFLDAIIELCLLYITILGAMTKHGWKFVALRKGEIRVVNDVEIALRECIRNIIVPVKSILLPKKFEKLEGKK